MFIYHFNRLIRNKILWIFFAFLMVLAFVVVDSCSSAQREQQEFTAGTLNGEKIKGTEFDRAMTVANIFDNNPNSTMVERRNATWQLIATVKTAEKYDITASVRAAESVIRTMFAGPGGEYNPAYLLQFLSRKNVTEKSFVELFTAFGLPSQIIDSTIASAAWTSPMETEAYLSALFDETQAQSVIISNPIKVDSIKIEEPALTKYYEENKADFTRPEVRNISYIAVPIETFTKDITISDADAEQFYDDFKDSRYSKPDTNGVPVEVGFETVKAEIVKELINEQALEKTAEYVAEKLILVAERKGLETAGSIVNATVQTLSELDVHGRPNVQNSADFTAATFDMDINSTPLNSSSGTNCVYLMALTKVTPEYIPAFGEVKEEIKQIVLAQERNKQFTDYSKSVCEKLNAELIKTSSTLEKAIEAAKLTGLVASTSVTFTIRAQQPTTFPYQQFVYAASFGTATGTVSEPMQIGAEQQIAVLVAKRTPGDALQKDMQIGQIRRELAARNSQLVLPLWKEWNLKNLKLEDAHGLTEEDETESETTTDIEE